ncbi:hypothetical protein DPEC_G00244180 [Dallia pectoralis]|uniref:Uncharacterized protein n=1 Tax=Dallia pectoralis TaxID=75939 RepID=A0ACC2FVR7_DALPE|nr:hypothetical protein DPEC_G00244180 [Dallia pectoralis]
MWRRGPCSTRKYRKHLRSTYKGYKKMRLPLPPRRLPELDDYQEFIQCFPSILLHVVPSPSKGGEAGERLVHLLQGPNVPQELLNWVLV